MNTIDRICLWGLAFSLFGMAVVAGCYYTSPKTNQVFLYKPVAIYKPCIMDDYACELTEKDRVLYARY